MENYLGQKVLVTTNQWFYAPNGQLYRSAWGTLKNVHEAKNVFGFIPNRTHANWVIEIGDMLIMGCQVLYCVKCPNKPDFDKVNHVCYDVAYGIKEFERPNEIYLAE